MDYIQFFILVSLVTWMINRMCETMLAVAKEFSPNTQNTQNTHAQYPPSYQAYTSSSQ